MVISTLNEIYSLFILDWDQLNRDILEGFSEEWDKR